MAEIVKLKWQRPQSSEITKVWHTFRARDVDSKELVEYRIEYLPASREKEALECLTQYFCGDEPLCRAYEIIKDLNSVDDFQLMWSSLLHQGVALVCYKEGSDEIVGLNMNYVCEKGDNFLDVLREKNKSDKTKLISDIMFLLFGNFDTHEHYGVDKYLSSIGLVVKDKYRGRGIGEHFLNTRRALCNEFGIKLSSTTFTSNFSNRIADKAGFKVDRSYSYTDVRNNHPEFKLPPIESDLIALKSIEY